jgi:hypothetical protein
MDTKELRIGNYVWDSYSGYMLVSQITYSTESVFLRKTWLLPEGIYLCKDIEPVFLTEEWLLKFRFEKVKRDYVMGIHDRIFSGLMKFQFDRLLQMWIFSVGKYKDITRIQYVHQLQNLYFALTGNELNLK